MTEIDTSVYVMPSFVGDRHDAPTTGVVFLTAGGDYANATDDPETMLAVAHRLISIADEINASGIHVTVEDQLKCKAEPGQPEHFGLGGGL